MLPALAIATTLLVGGINYWLPQSLITVLLTALGGVLIVLALPFFIVWIIGLNGVFLQIYDHGQPTTRSIIPSLRVIFKYIFAVFLNGALVTLGSILLIIPGLVIFTAYSFAYLPFFDNPKTGIWEAFRYSSRLAKGVGFKLFFFAYPANMIFVFFGGISYLLLLSIAMPSFSKSMSNFELLPLCVFYLILVLLYTLFKLATIHIYRTLETFEKNSTEQTQQETL